MRTNLSYGHETDKHTDDRSGILAQAAPNIGPMYESTPLFRLSKHIPANAFILGSGTKLRAPTESSGSYSTLPVSKAASALTTDVSLAPNIGCCSRTDQRLITCRRHDYEPIPRSWLDFPRTHDYHGRPLHRCV